MSTNVAVINQSSTETKKKDIIDWDNKSVIEWFKSKNIHFSQKLIENHEITGYDLFYLTDENLKKDFKIEIFHERQKILKEVRLLALDSCIYFILIFSETFCIL
jgi:hypothetical protein